MKEYTNYFFTNFHLAVTDAIVYFWTIMNINTHVWVSIYTSHMSVFQNFG